MASKVNRDVETAVLNGRFEACKIIGELAFLLSIAIAGR